MIRGLRMTERQIQGKLWFWNSKAPETDWTGLVQVGSNKARWLLERNAARHHQGLTSA